MSSAPVKRAMVFSGSGASYAVSSENYPTTVGFYNKLPRDLKSDRLLATLASHFEDKFGDKTADIEKLLWCIDELLTFFAPLSDAKSPAYWLVPNNVLPSLVGMNHNISGFAAVASQAASHLKKMRDRINAHLYDVYGDAPDEASLEMTWNPLISVLAKNGYWVDFVTTNYDLVLEAAVDRLEYDIGYGQKSGSVPMLDLDVWRKSLTEPGFVPHRNGLITKLHGSLSWERDRRGIAFGGSGFKSNHGHHVAIYPGFKGAPSEDPFSLFHDYFERRLQSCSLLVVIGFAFRDDYINTIFSRAPSIEKVVVVDPSELPLMPKQLQKNAFLFKDGFGKNAADFINEYLRKG